MGNVNILNGKFQTVLVIYSTPIFVWIDFDYFVVNQKDEKYNINNYIIPVRYMQF